MNRNKDMVVRELEVERRVLGCWDASIEKLSKAEITKVVDCIKYLSATDVKVKYRGKEAVVSVDFVDNEVDFTYYTKEEYISRFGEELFLED